jgi:hypothetical protein
MFRVSLLAIVTATGLSACGGGTSSAATPAPPAAVTGVATPQAVSVVTAN